MTEPKDGRDQRVATVAATIAFVVGIGGGIAFAIVYSVGAETGWYTQALGGSLAVATAAIGIGSVIWAHKLMPHGPEEEERPFPGRNPDQRAKMLATYDDSLEEIGRRRLLGRLLFAAVGVTGLASLFPIRSLGPSPFPERARTAWGRGVRLVTEEGHPIPVDELDVNGVLTVFPEGHIHDADAQTVLLRVPTDIFEPLEGREDWSVDGYVAYSKVCTHNGCPVGLYQVETQQLFCPCHQSAFDVLQGAKPTFGPATRPLPQLPLAVDGQGYLIAGGDYDVPVGPGFWTWPSAARQETG
ncbi:MAG: Rieske 2Fe-2S domain-containing protein [Actinomycetota bacterium]|nr:Rieske 2Fe-2S domain-containing protein [Actinomycetota bacterium]